MYFLQQYMVMHPDASVSIKHCKKKNNYTLPTCNLPGQINCIWCLQRLETLISSQFPICDKWQVHYEHNFYMLLLTDKKQANCKQLFWIYWLQIANNMHIYLLISIDNLIICNQGVKKFTNKHVKSVQIPWPCKANIVHHHFATNSKKFVGDFLF